jgi:hypothetical protein
MCWRSDSAGPTSGWCSASQSARLRTAFWYALRVLSAYPSARSANSHEIVSTANSGWLMPTISGTWSAVLQAPGGITGTSALLSRSASCAALVTA